MDCDRSANRTPARARFSVTVVAVATCLALVSVGHANEPSVAHPGLADARRDAMAAAAELNTQLRGQLQSALKSGGAVGAVAACSTIAPAVTSEVTKPTLTIKRTALRVRNENNAADEFELRVLSAFVAKTAAGADPSSLVHEEVVATPQGPAFRFIKAIPMADQPCATCHGKSIAPDVAAEVKRLYPRDQAVDFEAGQIRGAISVVRPLP